MTDEESLVAEALLGDEAKKFLTGELGRFLLGCAEQDAKLAASGLEDVDPSDQKKIRDLQNRVWRARSFEGWLNELVQRGEDAIKVYQQQKQEG